MKLPNQAQPITRGISTAKIIGAKGIVQNKNFVPDAKYCQEICAGRTGLQRARCIAACMAGEALTIITNS